MEHLLRECNICPHHCKVNREKGDKGRCNSGGNLKIALYSIHSFEEPCISGENGSGTVFFSNCNMNCKFCQNYEISQLGNGKEISIQELADIFLEQQEKKVHNINLVTPTSYVIHIIKAIEIAKRNGLNLPIVYNTNAYEDLETIKLLKGYVDIYMPDLKYADNMLAKKLSNVDRYFEIATEAIKEMYNQVGLPILNEQGIMKKGIMIRHLVLPNYIENSKKVLKWISDKLPKEIYISVMAQYFPSYKAKQDEKLNRQLTKNEWQQILDYIDELQFENGYIQELEENEEQYVPKWDF